MAGLDALRTGVYAMALAMLAPGARAAAADAPVPTEPEADPSALATTPVVWKRWALFDPLLSPRGRFLGGGVATLPEATGGGRAYGAQVFLGDSIRSEWRVGVLELERSLRLTARRASDVLVELPCYTLWGGLRLGRVELGVGAGVALFGVDGLDRGVALSFLSPSAVAKADVTFGRVRVAARVSSEYLWRWFDRRDVVIDAVTLELAFVAPPTGRLGSHPLDVRP